MDIGFDFDNVMNDMLELWCDYLNQKVEDKYKMMPQHLKYYDMKMNYPTLTQQQIWEPLQSKIFWYNVKAKSGAVNVIDRLLSEGHNVFIISNSYPGTLSDKYNYCILRLFPNIPWQNIIITARKDLVKLDVIVDDCPDNLKGTGYKKKILMLYNYNKQSIYNKDLTIVKSWNQILKEIEEIK